MNFNAKCAQTIAFREKKSVHAQVKIFDTKDKFHFLSKNSRKNWQEINIYFQVIDKQCFVSMLIRSLTFFANSNYMRCLKLRVIVKNRNFQFATIFDFDDEIIFIIEETLNNSNEIIKFRYIENFCFDIKVFVSYILEEVVKHEKKNNETSFFSRVVEDKNIALIDVKWRSCAFVMIDFDVYNEFWNDEIKTIFAWINDLIESQIVQVKLFHIEKNINTFNCFVKFWKLINIARNMTKFSTFENSCASNRTI